MFFKKWRFYLISEQRWERFVIFENRIDPPRNLFQVFHLCSKYKLISSIRWDNQNFHNPNHIEKKHKTLILPIVKNEYFGTFFDTIRAMGNLIIRMNRTPWIVFGTQMAHLAQIPRWIAGDITRTGCQLSLRTINYVLLSNNDLQHCSWWCDSLFFSL